MNDTTDDIVCLILKLWAVGSLSLVALYVVNFWLFDKKEQHDGDDY